MLDDELINDSFSYDVTMEYSFGFAVISTNTKKPKEFKDKIIEILLAAKI
jgi:hypothetical protein